MNAEPLNQLSFTVSAHIARPREQVYEAVADPARLSRYFTTGGAQGRLEPRTEVTWDFADFPGAFPVHVIEAEPPARLMIEWDAEHSLDASGRTRVVFEFHPVDDGARTRVTITETSWKPTHEGAESAFGNCAGWTGMLAALKVWVEHGINLREGFYR